MNMHLRILFVIIYMSLLPEYALSSENNTPADKSMEELCYESMSGKLNFNNIQKTTPSDNAYLFNCAISPAIFAPDEKPDSIHNRNKRKIEIANYLISQDLDIAYKDESDGSLLISVVISDIPEKWKIKFMKILISRGCDINKQNKYGKSALELAKITKESEMIKILQVRDHHD